MVHFSASPLDYSQSVADPFQFPDKRRALLSGSRSACPDAKLVVGPSMLAYVLIDSTEVAALIAWQSGEEREDSTPIPPNPQYNGDCVSILLSVLHGAGLSCWNYVSVTDYWVYHFNSSGKA